MANTKISIINASTVLTDEQVKPVIVALQTQASRDFAPIWGMDADLSFVPNGQRPPAGNWWLTILDDSDQGGTLGYHDLTEAGLPLGKVFAKTDIVNNLQWSVTASHELLEMLGDPAINLSVLVGNTLYAYEVCDSTESEQFAYEINGVKVSDFVFPSWFEPFHHSGSQFDFGNHVTAPLQLLPEGYIGTYDITSGNGWQQTTAQDTPLTYQMRPCPGSRRERRRTPQKHWITSKLVE
jgi:hypothetical protein